MTIPWDYNRKYIKMCHPLGFQNKEIDELQNRFLKELENFREPWITKEHISLPIFVLSEDGKQSNAVGVLTYYRKSKDGKCFSSHDKIF